MREIDEKEIQRVLKLCSKYVKKLTEDYKRKNNISKFKPVIKYYAIGETGFIALFTDKNNQSLASILNIEGNMIYSSYYNKRDMMH